MNVPAEIFRAYDIRGHRRQSPLRRVVREIGRAIGSLGRERGAPVFAVGRDGRLSSPELSAALMDGLNAAGADVIDIGVVPTPVTYFAAHHLGCRSAVMVTGSHNPGQDNGLKTVIADDTLSGEEIQDLRRRVESGRFASGAGKRTKENVLDAYVDRIAGDVRLARPFKVAIDSGNGRRRRDRAAPVPAPGLRGDGTVLGSGWALSQPPSGPFQAGKSFAFDSGTENGTGRNRPRLRRRRRPPGRRQQERQDHPARPPVDALCAGRAVPQSGAPRSSTT